MANEIKNKNFLDLKGLATYTQQIFAKIENSTFSKNYEELKNKPTIQKLTVDEATETLIIE